MMKRSLKTLNDIILFTLFVSWRIPPWRWGEAWHDLKDIHRQLVHKDVWEAKLRGEIYEDKDGNLWSKK
jgi:hypothetical protein